MTTLQLIPTNELDALVSRLAGGSPQLNNLERDAVLAAVQSEILERDAARRSVFRFASEKERLLAEIDQKDRVIFHLQSEVSLLEDQLKTKVTKVNGEANSNA